MKRYLLFAGSNYYPSGGWDDFEGSFDSAAEALAAVPSIRVRREPDWFHVIDSQTGERVLEG